MPHVVVARAGGSPSVGRQRPDRDPGARRQPEWLAPDAEAPAG